ncbi:CatA-like O-acetyltransferase [Sneathiella chinensis]|uniref:Chloramphenicol acetyltransferase n=1 Tax=Sneathiella chinensis TaxID=349750 RepID=A0ABQ5UAN7_9PROT|nr:CatA-like O-acetyltransferase [Sneathiella chinensis]GLQ07631.1 chloramphenicol acetyltransferase [Sneathiella chinensis]
MKEIDIRQWDRRGSYELFRKTANPHFSITADIDATRFMEEVKPTGISVFNGVLFAIMTAVNSIPEMRLRLRGDAVVEHEVTHPSFTVPIKGNQFAFCQVRFTDDWTRFNALCTAEIAAGKAQTVLTQTTKTDEWTYLSCAPWTHFTGLTHPTNGPDDCIPRIAWGRISKINDRWSLPLNLQAHHALMDGYHASLFLQRTEETLKSHPFS